MILMVMMTIAMMTTVVEGGIYNDGGGTEDVKCFDVTQYYCHDNR